MSEDNRNIEELIEPGFDIIGNSVGSTMGALVGASIAGLPGMIAGSVGGAVLTTVFSEAGKEIKQRYLGIRETARIGAVTFFALSKINENLRCGLELRNDSFFTKNLISNRSTADEIFEGTILAAQREVEEMKIQFIGNLYGNIAFHSEIGKIEANRLIRIAQSLSYNQLCLLTFVDEMQPPLSDHMTKFRGISIKLKEGYIYFGNDDNDFSFSIFANEFEDLSNKKLIGTLGHIASGSNVPTDMRLTPLGKKLCELMEIKIIDTDTICKSIKFFIEKS